MAIKDYSTEPDMNTSISGINIAEGCPPSGINNAIRQLMADVKAESEATQSAQAIKNSEQDAAISAAQSSADEKVSAVEELLRDLVEEEKAALQGQIQNAVPAGTVIAFAANSNPDGYLLCNGAAVSRTTYAKLFEAIGTTYGAGNGSTTFSLPNIGSYLVSDVATGDVPVAGTGKALFLTDGSASGYLMGGSPGSVFLNTDENGTIPHYRARFSLSRDGYNIGVTTDSDKSGLIAKMTANKTAVKYYIKY